MISPKTIRETAREIGYDDVGITTAKIPPEDIASYLAWLRAGNHAGLTYMEKQIRTSPEELLPGAKTAILFVTYYKQERREFVRGKGLIASYARGRDYHHLHRKRIKKFIQWLEKKSGEKNIAKGFSDSTPIMERALAVQAGLGWFGKNTLLIHRRFGTFTLLSGVLTTLEIEGVEKKERLPRCGSCTRCLDSCPTGALTPYSLNANLCLSYHLIESKAPIPKEIAKKNPGFLLGCDICQDVCPHNVRKPLSDEATFAEESGFGSYLDLSQLQEIEKEPERLFGTPLQRRGVKGLQHNLLSRDMT